MQFADADGATRTLWALTIMLTGAWRGAPRDARAHASALNARLGLGREGIKKAAIGVLTQRGLPRQPHKIGLLRKSS